MKVLLYFFIFGFFILFLTGLYSVYRVFSLKASAVSPDISRITQPSAAAADFQAKLEDGKKQFHVRGCAKCHGFTGLGDGEKTARLLALGIVVPALNNAAHFSGGSSPEEIQYTLRFGIQGQKTPSASADAMPKYPHLSAGEIENIALYVRKLAGLE